MKKGYIIIIIGICFFFLLIYFLWGLTYTLEPEPPLLIKKIDIDKQNRIEILYIAGNTTSQNYTIIKKINNKTKEEFILDNYERYNFLEKYYLEGDNLTLILRDTSVHYVEIIDTLRLNIQDVKYKIE
jgi:hypothetical protein